MPMRHTGLRRGIETPLDMNLFMATLRTTFPQHDREVRGMGLSWLLPVFVFQGETDLNAPEAMARQWPEEIEHGARKICASCFSWRPRDASFANHQGSRCALDHRNACHDGVVKVRKSMPYYSGANGKRGLIR
jgi:hypothetical protein